MAGDFDSFFQQTDQLEGTDYTFVDADTLRDQNDNRYRLQGVDAPEISKVDPTTGLPGYGATAGAGVATQEIMGLANSHGFTNVIKTGKLDPHGREIIRLQDKNGRDFANTLLKTGALKTNRYTTQKDTLSAEVGDVLRSRKQYEETDWDKGAAAINEAINDETFYEAGFKQAAITEKDLAHGIGSPGYVEFRSYDRDLKDKAVNPLSESFDLGIKGVQEGMWGALNLIGETSDWDWAKDIGEAGVYRARAKIADKPQLKLSALDDEGNWDIDGVGEFFEFLGNNAAVSLPYMAATIGGTILAPVTKGLSLTAPVSIYTGQTWNEMEGANKNAGVAIVSGVTQAVLDRIGLKGLAGGNILKDATRKAAINKIIQDAGGNLSKRAASNILAQYTRKEIAQLAGDIGKVSAEQISARNIARGLLKAGAKGGVTEATTEALQEAIGYTAAHHVEGFNAVDFNNRILNAVIAGGTLGKGFGLAGGVYETGAWADLAVRQAPADASRRSIQGKRAQDEIDKYGRVKSIQEITTDLDAETNRRASKIKQWEDRVKDGNKQKLGGSVFDKAKDLWTEIPGLWRKATGHILTQELQGKSRALRKLADMFNANNQKLYSGSHFENRKHHLLTEYRNMVADPLAVAEGLGHKGFRSAKNIEQRNKILSKFSEYVKQKEAAGQSVNFSRLPAELRPYRSFLGAYHQQVLALGDKLYADQAKYNKDLGYLQNYLYHYKSFNKAAIEKNRNSFIEKLVAKGMDREQARSVTDEILGADTVNGPGDFHIGRGRQIPGSHRARTLNLADDVNFQEFMEQDMLSNMSNAAKSAARYVAYQEFVGDNNAKMNELLEQAKEEGVSEAELDKVAARMQDYLDAESGNYKRIKNENWNAIQQNLMFWTMLAGLPLATVSSFVEMALTTRALTKDQVFKTIKNIAKEGAQGLFGKMKLFNSETSKQREKQNRQQTLKDLGYFNWEVGAAHTTGVSETSHSKQRLIDVYFRAIQLQQWTDYTRNVRGSMAGDFVLNHLETIANQRNSGSLYTNEIQEAEEQLRNLGINVDDMINIYNTNGPLSPEQQRSYQDQMREATFNFINEAVALPQSANRPLFYQNPHLALFTQFQGFISTFTANHIPKLWGELVQRGTPSMKYNAFAVMTTMIALGFVSQYLKDLLKYNKPSPYLDDAEKLQRAIGASGLLGTGERVLNFFFPIYEQSSDGPIEWFFNTATGESAAASNIARAGESLAKIAKGETERGAYGILKTTPFLGPFNQLNKDIAGSIFG